MKIGINLGGLNYWSSSQPFLNIFHLSNQWSPERVRGVRRPRRLSNAFLDSDGWVTDLPKDRQRNDIPVSTRIMVNTNGYPSGRYVVLYEGEGNLRYSFDARENRRLSRPGRDVIDVRDSNKGITVTITSTDPNDTGDYIRNIRIVPIANERNYSTQIFNPAYLQKINRFEAFRFMDWMFTNNSRDKTWEDRPTINSATFFKQGVPVEMMVDLANRADADPWFTIPHQADDEYVRNFAQYVKDNLEPGRKVYVEYSNEVWNPSFAQYRYALSQARREFPNRPIRQAAVDWFSMRTTEITRIWDDVFGPQKNRVMGVMATRGNDPERTRRALDYAWAPGNPSHKSMGIDAIATNHYFGYYIGHPSSSRSVASWTRSPDGGLDQLFDEITQGGNLRNGPSGGALEYSLSVAQAQQQIARQEGLPLLAYEAGQHLVGVRRVRRNEAISNLFIQANRDRRMEDVYKQHFRNWASISNGIAMQFNDVSHYSQFGSWGLLENLEQNSSPKYNAILDLMN